MKLNRHLVLIYPTLGLLTLTLSVLSHDTARDRHEYMELLSGSSNVTRLEALSDGFFRLLSIAEFPFLIYNLIILIGLYLFLRLLIAQKSNELPSLVFLSSLIIIYPLFLGNFLIQTRFVFSSLLVLYLIYVVGVRNFFVRSTLFFSSIFVHIGIVPYAFFNLFSRQLSYVKKHTTERLRPNPTVLFLIIAICVMSNGVAELYSYFLSEYYSYYFDQRTRSFVPSLFMYSVIYFCLMRNQQIKKDKLAHQVGLSLFWSALITGLPVLYKIGYPFFLFSMAVFCGKFNLMRPESRLLYALGAFLLFLVGMVGASLKLGIIGS